MDFGDVLDKWEAMQSVSHKRQSLSRRAKQHTPCPPAPENTSHKKANAPSLLRASPSSDSLCRPCNPPNASPPAASSAIRKAQEEWIHKHVTFDKDAIADEEARRQAERSTRYVKSMPPDARLDLHGYTQSQAWSRLSDFIGECIRRGARKVLIIHGKGIHTKDSDGVLSGVVRDFIECDGRCGQSGHPDRRQGGQGATWVILKY